MSDKKKRKVHQIDEPEETQFTKITQKKNWQKNVVTALCPLIDEESDKEKRIKIYTYQCPFEGSGRCRSRSVRLGNNNKKGFKVNTRQGYSNAIRHLTLCFGSKTCLFMEYENYIKCGKKQLENYFVPKRQANEREIVTMKYLEVIIDLSLPLTWVKNESFRKFSGESTKLSYAHMKNVILELVKIVEILRTPTRIQVLCKALKDIC